MATTYARSSKQQQQQQRQDEEEVSPVDDYLKQSQSRRFKLKTSTILYAILFVLLCIMAMYVFLYYHVQITITTNDDHHEKIYETDIGINVHDFENIKDKLMQKIPKSAVNNHNIHEDHHNEPHLADGKQNEQGVRHEDHEEEQQRDSNMPPLTDIVSYARSFESDRNSRREAVRNAFQFAYSNYERLAFGLDELKPVSGSGHNWVRPSGMGMTLVDSLDTMFIMGLSKEFERATDWVANKFPDCRTFDWEGSVFETTIRMVGGLLSAYELSGNKIFLTRAKQIAECLMPGFDTPTGIPYSAVQFKNRVGVNYSWNHMASVLSEFGSVQLEFRKLSQLTGDQKYDNAVTKIMNVMKEHEPKDGLYPVLFHPQTSQFIGDRITLGALGDSWYEYLLKQWLLTDRKENRYKEMYLHSLNGIMEKLVKTFKTDKGELSFISEMNNGRSINKVDHLVCFAAGMMALGESYHVSPADKSEKVMQVAKNFAHACYESYRMTPTGLGPEIFHYNEDGTIRPGARTYLLRPETVESLFILYRVTGDKMYQDWAWDIFQAIEKHCKTRYGYSGVKSVMETSTVQHDDLQQSFLLAETFKYLYLIFSPDNVIPLDQWIFNTEAHPLRVIS